MQEITKQLTSPSWWVSVVIVGVLASLTAAYLKPRIDSILGSVSGRYRRRNERQAKARAEQIETIRSDRYEQIMFAISISYQMLLAIINLLLGSLLLMTALFLCYLSRPFIIIMSFFIVGTLTVITGIWGQVKCMSDNKILREARKSPTQEIKKTGNQGIS